MKLVPNGMHVTVATDQRFGLSYGSEHQKDDVVRIADVGQALGCLVDFDGLDIGQEVSQQCSLLVAGQLELGVGEHPQELTDRVVTGQGGETLGLPGFP